MWSENKAEKKLMTPLLVGHSLSLMAQFLPPIPFFHLSLPLPRPPIFRNSEVEWTFPPFAEQAVSRY